MEKDLQITMNLPDGFLDCMKSTLKNDFNEYLNNLNNQPFRGLRINTLKADIDFVRKNIGFETKALPFADNGFYIDNNLTGVGNHPYHHCGAIYLQEPSAMSPVTVLAPCPGEKILDMCAAPGGKSTQIAERLLGKGLLWSNEYVYSRAKILCSNLERCGVKNSVVSNSDSKTIADNLCGFFDKVLVDAPCSGEGMIRREANAVKEWNIKNRDICAKRQAEILDNAAKCLKANGILVYSTCTLSIEENEATIEAFLERNKDFELLEIPFSFGRKGYTYFSDNTDLEKCRRILFSDGGEGHFIAKLIKKSHCEADCKYFSDFDDKNIKIFFDFYNEHFNDTATNVYNKNNIVYLLPDFYPETKGIRILKAGVKAGEIIKNRFAPSHELYMSKSTGDIKSVLNLTLDDDRINKFLHGLELDCYLNGYTAVAVDKMIVGFGKSSNNKLKNHYPKGLRIV